MNIQLMDCDKGKIATPIWKCMQNLHTHTNYGDGIHSVEEMIRFACDKGFKSIGFSEHSPLPFYLDYAMTKENVENYNRECHILKEKYQGMIHVYCGLELDVFSNVETKNYDYVIGSVHCILHDGEVVEYDRSVEDARDSIIRHFDGDGMRYVRAYYEKVRELPSCGQIDILGHFDLPTKFCEREMLFDTKSKAYRNLILETAEALVGKIPYFEVNSGAISRGYRTNPYPDSFIVKELKHMGFGAVITSDCHDGRYLDCGFSQAVELLKTCGYEEHFIFTEEGFVPEKIH